MIGEEGKRPRSLAVLARSGRRVVAEGERERQQVSLRRALVIVHQQAAETKVEALVLAEDLVRTDRSERERDGERDDQRQALAQGDELIRRVTLPDGTGSPVLRWKMKPWELLPGRRINSGLATAAQLRNRRL